MDSGLSWVDDAVKRCVTPWLCLGEMDDDLRGRKIPHADHLFGVSIENFGRLFRTPLMGLVCMLTAMYLNMGTWRREFGERIVLPTGARGRADVRTAFWSSGFEPR